MIEPLTTPALINGGTTPITLAKNPKFVNTLVSFKGRSTGIISFRTKAIYSEFQTPGAPYTIDLATNKSISFLGEALEAIELTDAGSGSVTVNVTQYS
ncbi:MAG TPA: hypothetical protein VN030_11500 [Cellvibrio sp.]|nr:hypothetical protein [Cellvibrio sp.]